MIEDYRKARKRGLKEVNRALAEGLHPFPPALDEEMANIPFARETSVGTMEIPLNLVVGTRVQGRSNMFSASFMPLGEEDTEFAAKWSALYDSQVAEGLRDPIQVYECLQRFFVQEGNKRVSVSRYLGATSIMAQVSRVVPVATDELKESLERYEAFERFFSVCPLYEMELPEDRDYQELADLFGRTLDEPWPAEDVKRLKAAYYLFRSSFLKCGGEMLDLSCPSAFLRYLETYKDAAHTTLSAKELEVRLRAMWSEFLVAEGEETVAFVDEPETPKDTSVVKKAISKVKKPKQLRVAFVYDRTPATSGWVSLFEEGRAELTDRLGEGIHTKVYEGCSNEVAFGEVVDEAVADGCSIIVTVSPRQMTEARRAAVTHKDVQFLNCSLNLSSGMVRCFYARMYEVKFLMGALAASLTESHQLAYLATAPINGAAAEVNAFALGAAMVDPKAVVHLRWRTGLADWREDLLALGVDMVSGLDYLDPTHAEEPFGLYALKDDATHVVARPVWEWGRYLELMLPTVAKEAGKAEALSQGRAINYWWGMRFGVVRLDLAEGLPQGQRRLVGMFADAICRETLSPFDTLLVDQQGSVIRAEGDPRLSDDEIASMNWLNINVEGLMPTPEDLTEAGKAFVAAADANAARRKKA